MAPSRRPHTVRPSALSATCLKKASRGTHNSACFFLFWWIAGHGLDARNYPYNDGAVGYSMGAMPVSTSYVYNFHASPAGTSWYHGKPFSRFWPIITRR
jgi:hypothetical protein